MSIESLVQIILGTFFILIAVLCAFDGIRHYMHLSRELKVWSSYSQHSLTNILVACLILVIVGLLILLIGATG